MKRLRRYNESRSTMNKFRQFAAGYQQARDIDRIQFLPPPPPPPPPKFDKDIKPTLSKQYFADYFTYTIDLCDSFNYEYYYNNNRTKDELRFSYTLFFYKKCKSDKVYDVLSKILSELSDEFHRFREEHTDLYINNRINYDDHKDMIEITIFIKEIRS